MSKSRTTQILYTRRRDVTTDGELNVLASVYRFILFESSGPTKKVAEPAPEPSSRDAVIVTNKEVAM